MIVKKIATVYFSSRFLLSLDRGSLRRTQTKPPSILLHVRLQRRLEQRRT